MINRQTFIDEIAFSFQIAPVCGLIGPRQCGKTTIAKEIASQFLGEVHHFDLEDDRDQNKMLEPLLILENLEGLIVIDEIHHAPNLFKILRVLVDQKKNRKFLVLGSASGELLKQTSETLAGRINFVEMMPFGLKEVDFSLLLHIRGGYPLSFLARSERVSVGWRKAYIKGSLVAVGANESVVPASDLQDAMRRIKQLEGALGRKTLENEILKEAVDFAKAKKWIARSPVLPGDEQ